MSITDTMKSIKKISEIMKSITKDIERINEIKNRGFHALSYEDKMSLISYIENNLLCDKVSIIGLKDIDSPLIKRK